MTRPIRVLLVDDDPLVRSGLTMMIDGAGGISVVGEASDGTEVPGLVDAHAPDVVLMDLRMPRVDGIVTTGRLCARPAPPAVLVLTTFDSDENVVRALRAGASGFLLKDTPPARIVAAIQAVAAGEPTLSPEVTRRLMDRVVSDSGQADRARGKLAALSPRERDVVRAVAEGRSNASIATKLSMSTATVKAHLTHIFIKLGVDNRTQIAVLAHDAGW